MKSFAFVLLCVIAAVQGRSTGVQVTNSQRSPAARGENPWVVHLRVAVSTSGFLETSAGSIISDSWVLTSAESVHDARFIWARFGAVETIRPELVLETSAVRVHPVWSREANNIGLVALNRLIDFTDHIAPIALPAQDSDLGTSGWFCGYGENEGNSPGDYLSCYNVEIFAIQEQALVTSNEIPVSKYDSGASLVDNGELIGLVASHDVSGGHALFTRVGAYIDWIVSQTGIQVGRVAPTPGPPEAPEGIIIVDN